MHRHRPDAGGRQHDVQPRSSPSRRAATSSRSRSTTAGHESYGAGGTKGGANIPLTLQGPARLRLSYDDATHKIGIAPTDLPGPATSADKALAGSSLREPLTRERFYFVMADRFANGDKANDTGGLTGGREQTGYDPTDKGFYHGGDLTGLTNKLDYIKGLGTTAIWLTPAFKNRPVQGTGADASAGYHGYWITDFTQVDPHLGTNDDMKKLVDAAHRKGMKVFFDIITNHTADVIDYQGGQHAYVDKATKPYRDAAGKAFDDAGLAGGDTFPALDAQTSFPYTPVFRTEADKTVKVPAWLNDPTMYHNRGDSTFAGESTTYGDFSGLDDLWTEQPAVVNGMTDIYKKWVDFGIDGFRIDTVKHVNTEFWQKFSPAVLARAKADGKKDFFMFGEVYDGNPAVMSRVHHDRQAARHARLRLPGQRARLRAGQGDDQPARLLRRRRLLHRHRLQRLRAADLPRQPRHGPHRHDAQERRRDRPGPARPGRAGQLADVPHPRPAGRLLRRRAGLHRQRR